jgi:hypothetical protein
LQKYSDFQKTQIGVEPAPSTPPEGRIAIVTDAGLDAMDAEALLTNGADADGKDVWSRRLGAGVKSVEVSAGDGGKKADHRGDHVISRKPLRGESRCDSG